MRNGIYSIIRLFFAAEKGIIYNCRKFCIQFYFENLVCEAISFNFKAENDLNKTEMLIKITKEN